MIREEQAICLSRKSALCTCAPAAYSSSSGKTCVLVSLLQLPRKRHPHSESRKSFTLKMTQSTRKDKCIVGLGRLCLLYSFPYVHRQRPRRQKSTFSLKRINYLLKLIKYI